MQKKKETKLTGCTLCKYRVSIPKKQGDDLGERIPSCCFHFEVNDKKDMHTCCMFTETDFYIKHPEYL